MQTVLITGASKGIGLEIAQTLQKAGYQVFGTSRNPSHSSGLGFRLLPLDITAPESIDACVNAALAEANRIDVLINNVGYDLYAAAEETSPEEFAAQITTNFLGTAHFIRRMLPHMRVQGGGKIINISSLGGMVSLPYNSAYSASKFALEGYSESLRYELLPHRIYVSLVEAGSVRTETLATSIQTPAHSHPVYAIPRQHMVEIMHKSGNRSRIVPRHIARTIQGILDTPAPRLRYTVGAQARFVPLLKALMPQRLFEGFIVRQFMSPETAVPKLEEHHAR